MHHVSKIAALILVVTAGLPAFGVPRPRTLSLCIGLLSIVKDGPRLNLEPRFHDVIRRAHEALGRQAIPAVAYAPSPDDRVASHPRDPASLPGSLARMRALVADLDDPAVHKSVLFVSGREDMRIVTKALAQDGGHLDEILDQVLPPGRPDEDERTRSALLDVLPGGADAFHHLGTSLGVPRDVVSILEHFARHEHFDLYDVRRVALHARELPNSGDLLLFDQIVYRDPSTGEYTYVGVVRVRERGSRGRAVH